MHTAQILDMNAQELIIEQQKESRELLQQILVQTTKTNGSVLALQEWRKEADADINKLKGINDFNKGREKVFVGLILLLGGIVGWAISTYFSIKK